MSDEDEELEIKVSHKKRKVAKNEFIDDEAELSGDDAVSEDEFEASDDDQPDLDLVDQDAPELDTDEEEEVRGLYHKQLENEDKRAVLLLQEHLEDKEVAVGQRRRRKFRWQTAEIMENSLRRHYDPDDDDSEDGDDDDDDDIEDEIGDLQPRLRRPTAESLLINSTRLTTTASASKKAATENSTSTVTRSGFSDDSNSNTVNSRTATIRPNNSSSDMSRFLYRDKELVNALSTRESVIVTREEKDKVIQREMKRVLQSQSIFDQLYG